MYGFPLMTLFIRTMIGGQKQEGSDIIIQILINGKDRTRKYDKFGSEIQYNITWDSDKPNKKYLTIFNFCEFALRKYDIWNSKDGDILERIEYYKKFSITTKNVFEFYKDRYWLQESQTISYREK